MIKSISLTPKYTPVTRSSTSQVNFNVGMQVGEELTESSGVKRGVFVCVAESCVKRAAAPPIQSKTFEYFNREFFTQKIWRFFLVCTEFWSSMMFWWVQNFDHKLTVWKSLRCTKYRNSLFLHQTCLKRISKKHYYNNGTSFASFRI